MTPARNPGQVCACFPGSCRGGEVINGRTVTGHCCRNEVGKAICEPAAIEAAFAADCEAEREPDGRTHPSASNAQQLEVADPWRDQAIDLLQKGERLSVSLLMRRLEIRFLRATFVMEQLTREGLIDAQGMARPQAAPQPEAKPDERFDWSDFRAISEAKEVDEAIRALLENQDEDNAVCMVRAVIEEAGERLARLAAASSSHP